MFDQGETVADLRQRGWIPARALECSEASARALGGREWRVGNDFSETHGAFVDLAIAVPGGRTQVLRGWPFHRADRPDFSTPDCLRFAMLQTLSLETGESIECLSTYRREWEAEWRDEGYAEPPEPVFADPVVERAFQDLSDFEEVLAKLNQIAPDLATRVEAIFASTWLSAMQVREAQLERRLGDLVGRARGAAAQRACAAQKGGEDRAHRARRWQRPCWAWVAAQTNLRTQDDRIQFIIANWDQRPFQFAPDGGACPAYSTLRGLLPKWKAGRFD